MKAIIAVNNLGFIGMNDTLPWRCKEDLQHFKKMTIGCHLLAGYRTINSLPPLKDRVLYMDHRDSWRTDVEWCIGGKKTYEKYASYFTELHISHINDNTIGNVTFPDLTNLNPSCKIFNYYFEPNGN
jgi:dihydrofolate reductase